MNEELTTLQVLMLENEIKDIGDAIMDLYRNYKTNLVEAIDDFLNGDNDLGFMFDEAKKRFIAAKRGLALTNKLQDPMQRKENKSRVLSNLNKLRAIKNRLEQSIDDLINQAKDQSQNRDLFQKSAQPGVQSSFNPAARPPEYRQRPQARPQPQQAQQPQV